MNELIKVSYENERATISGRELYEFLEVKTPYKQWFDRVTEYGFIEHVDFMLFTQKCASSNASGIQTKTDHQLTISMAKEIAMIQRNGKGKQARAYFIECEQKLKDMQLKQLPHDYISALKALIEAEEQKIAMQPKVEYYHKVLNPDPDVLGFSKLVTSTAIAKDLGMSAQKLNKLLNQQGIIYKQSGIWYLYSKHEDKIPEYADYTINEYGQSLKFTEKGREWIISICKDLTQEISQTEKKPEQLHFLTGGREND